MRHTTAAHTARLVQDAATLVTAAAPAHHRATTGAPPQPGDITASRTAGAAVQQALDAGATGADIARAQQ